MLKFMYVAKRKPTLTPEAFIKRWRQHATLAMSLPFWKNMLLYVHTDPIRPAPISGVSLDYDAVSYTVARDDSLFTNPSPDAAANAQTMLDDETETFAAPIPPCSLIVEEEVLKKGGPGGVTAFLFFNDLGSGEAVASAYAGSRKLSRVVLNRVRKDLKMSEKPMLAYKAAVEVSAADVETLTAALDPSDKGAWRKANLAVIGREAVLWDKISQP
jgi:hypothetical protein